MNLLVLVTVTNANSHEYVRRFRTPKCRLWARFEHRSFFTGSCNTVVLQLFHSSTDFDFTGISIWLVLWWIWSVELRCWLPNSTGWSNRTCFGWIFFRFIMDLRSTYFKHFLGSAWGTYWCFIRVVENICIMGYISLRFVFLLLAVFQIMTPESLEIWHDM